MNRPSFTALLLASICLLASTGCSQRDKVVEVADDDPEMVAAIAKARASLPQFWEVFDRHSEGDSDFALKVKITDANGTEHFWATDLQRSGGKTTGTINNDPNTVKKVKLGDRIEIPEADVSDWLYMRGGKMYGNYTLKPLFKSMPAAEVEKLKAIMAEPE